MKGGFYGDQPSLADLQAQDMALSVDFRRIYVTVADRWLGIGRARDMFGRQDPLDLFL